MDLKMIDPMTLYVLIGGVLVIFVGLGLRQVETLQKTVPLWLWSGLAGMMIGAGSAAFAVSKIESIRTQTERSESTSSTASSPTSSSLSGPTGGAPGSGRSAGPVGGGPGGGVGPGGGGGPGGNNPRSRRDLTTLIGKLEILTRGVYLDLDAEQKSKLSAAIATIDQDDEMTEEAAKEQLDSINAILTAENTDILASIELPRGRQGGQGGANASGGAMPRPNVSTPSVGAMPAPPLMSGSSAGGAGQPSNDNPFKQDDNAKRLKQLRERIR